MTDPTDYRALFLKAEEDRKKEAELRRQAEEREKQAEEREKQAEEGKKQAEEGKKQAEEREKQAEEREKQAEKREKQAEARERRERERNQRTTFEEFIRFSHNLLSQPLRAGNPDESTTGSIPPPTGKYCPSKFRLWTDYTIKQQEIYNSVHRYLQPAGRDAPRLFPPLIELEGLGQRFARRFISSEKDLETYERIAVEDHVHDIISELCKIPQARDEFRLGDGVWFENHANALDDDTDEPEATCPSTSRPDQFCIHRVDSNTKTMLTTIEYKPPHKLSVENLRAGLRPIDFYNEIIAPDTLPTDGPEKLRYNAIKLTGSAVVQEYHVMIQEGCEYSCLTTGLGNVQLWVPYDNPSTLYYHLGEPNLDANANGGVFQGSKTEIGRLLCLCLMSCRSQLRGQVWRNTVQTHLPIWETSFSYTRSQIPAEELKQKPPDSDYLKSTSPVAIPSESEYQPSSSPVESPMAQGRRLPTRSLTGCAPPNGVSYRDDASDSDADPGVAPQRKRGFSQITSSPPIEQTTSASQITAHRSRGGQSRPHGNKFCTQQCLLGLQQGGALDVYCPNVELHRYSKNSNRHPVNAECLVKMLKLQLDKDPDYGCTPIGSCGSYGAPFKITCSVYGYTVVGKGTTSRLWKEVSREADVYRILRRVQGSAVPVFLGTIDMAQIYFLHGAGRIRHMLLMAWGGENMAHIKHDKVIRREISRSKREIRQCGIIHEDLRPENILWNAELNRALIIDFHRCTLDRQPADRRALSIKRKSRGAGEPESKRVLSMVGRAITK
ncbi:hypothetical protein BDV28DRAFT_155401 [Aspergillus coremiiformis]|uniref:Protein kinase domain-containing protein n=1 Tax=Aspergillus coremiiformis TaxID=138285 RepID=A0A5N6ZH99_9EURO|nr:hypothetical protein BDV28DRAFT_155401 [Aspergillus coremiiformis]